MKKKPSKTPAETTPKKPSTRKKPTQAKAGTTKRSEKSRASQSVNLAGGPGIRDGRGSNNIS
jgi:hypothetical protein